MLLSIITVSWNTRQLLHDCIASVRAELDRAGLGPDQAEMFVVDNNSADGSAEMVARDFAWVKLHANKENLGFAKGNNQAIRESSGDFVLLLNPDTEVKPGAFLTLIDFLKSHPKAGVVAPQLLNSDGSIQRSCRAFPTFFGMLAELVGLSKMFPAGSKFGQRFRAYKMLDWQHDDERQVDQPEGAALMIRREVLDKAGRLDEGYFMLFEEVDWCFTVKRNYDYEIWFTPRAQIVHHYGQSIKQVKVKMIISSHRGLYRFWHKHYRGNRQWLDGFAYASLMALAYIRIAAYKLKGAS